jgi:hypothetical protein
LLRCFILNVQEGYLRVLHREGFDNRLAYATRTAGYDDDATAKAWVGGKSPSLFHAAFLGSFSTVDKLRIYEAALAS